MSSQTPRRISLRRKRQFNNVKTTGSSNQDHLSSSFKEEELEEKSSVTDKSYKKDKHVSKNIIEKLESPKTLKVATVKSDKKSVPPSTPNYKQYNGFSSATPISGRRNSFNSQRLLALQRSTESRTQQFSSPDSPFMCSQLPGTQDCEVVWDCNSPGFSKDELKRLNVNLVSRKTPSPKGTEILHPNRILFNRNRPKPRTRRENSSSKSNGIVAELDNLLTKVQAEELTHLNDSLSEDECMPEALPPSGVLKTATQPFNSSILNVGVLVSQINDKNSTNNIVGLNDQNIQASKSDHLPALRPINPNSQNEIMPEDAIYVESETEMSDEDFDDAILEDSFLNNIINNNQGKLGNKSSVSNLCLNESSFLEVSNAHNATQRDTLNSTTEFEDDDIFSDSLLLCTQELENALYNKNTGKFDSPSAIIGKKVSANSFPLNKYLIKSDSICKSNEKLSSIKSNGNLGTNATEQKCTKAMSSLSRVSRTSFQLGTPILPDNKISLFDSCKLVNEQGCDVLKTSNSDLQSYKRNSSTNPNALYSKYALGTLTRSMSANSNNGHKVNTESLSGKNSLDLSNKRKPTGATVPLGKHFSTNSPLNEFGFNAKIENSEKVSNGIKHFQENYKASAGSSSLQSKLSTRSSKLCSESVDPANSNINNEVHNSSMVDLSQDATSVLEKGFSEEDNDDEFFASLIPLVEKEEKSYANLAHCMQDSGKKNAEIEISLVGSNDINNFRYKNDNGRCNINKKEANNLKSTVQSAISISSAKQASFLPQNGADNHSYMKINFLDKNINKTVDKNCDIDLMSVKKKLDISSKNDSDLDVSKTYLLPSVSKASRSSFKLEPLASTSHLFKANSTTSICAGVIPSEKLNNIGAKNDIRRCNVKENQMNNFQLPLPSNKTAPVKTVIQPLSSQNDSDSFDDEDDFFDEDLLDEISIMESQVQSSSQNLKPSSVVAKSDVVCVNKMKTDSNDNFSYQGNDRNRRECTSDSRVTSEEQSRFDEFFSLRSPVSLKSQQMTLKDKFVNIPNFKGFAAVNPSLVENTRNIPMKTSATVNRIENAFNRVGGEAALKDVGTLKNKVNNFQFTKSSKQNLKGSSNQQHPRTKDEIAQKREEALRKRHKLAQSSFVS